MTYSGSNYRGAASVPPAGGSGGARVAAAAGGGPTRRGLIGSAIGLVASVAAAGGGFSVWSTANDANSDLDRAFDLGDLEDRPEDTPALNVLILGSDHREGNAEEDARSDTAMIMHVNEGGTEAYAISIPRDLYVPIPEDPDAAYYPDYTGTNAKFNAAYAWGGVNTTVKTVEALTGVRIDHIVEIDFNGLIEVVDALGGIDIDVEVPEGQDTVTSIHEPYREFSEGVNHLNGEEALDYVRQRKQYADGDFARMRHQQDLIKAIMDSALTAGVLTDRGKLTAFIESTSDAIKVDTDFNVVGTAIELMGLRSDDIVFMTTPNLGTGDQGGESVVIYADDPENPEASNPEAVSLWEALREDTMAEWVEDNPEAAGQDEGE
ncbi:LCP family protein [Glycomyces buryatensis]|uniref:LytR family transcriptional regulator n=1 Tax=Glycomyces buryatensis TaxID=2570927 RepID=A0A4S8Q1H6_9ACTN|nr:LCP family protein [Glycomyces buryatensis]THV33954.1 LytR family transcriptional regulator [Glycomyces buryatensis]